MPAEHLRALVTAFAVAGCTPTQPSGPRVPPTGSPDAAEIPGTCGARSFRMHRRPADSLEAIARRKAGTIACATRCDPTPAFATGPLARNEHGGYGYLDLAAAACQFPGMDLSLASCSATCEGQDLLGRIDVETQPQEDGGRAALCREFEAERGPPSVGSCACPDHDIGWLPTPTLAGVELHFQGRYTLDCGFPGASYDPTREPG